MGNVISQVIVLFLVMFCGFASSRFHLISDEGVSGLNKMVVYFSLPCLTIAKLQTDVEPELVRDLAAIFFLAGAAIMICGLLGRFVFFRGEEPARRAVLSSMCFFSNAGYMGYPVLTAAFGPEKLIYGVLYVAMFNILNWSVGVVLYDPSKLSLKKLIRVPSLVASLVGILLFAFRIRLPGVVVSAMDMMGNMTTPLALFVVGVRLTQVRLGDLRDAKLLFACALRLLAFPVATWAVLRLLGFSGMVLAVMTLYTAMPTATAVAIQAETYGGDRALASRCVAVSTLLSILTIPLIMLLL